VRRCILIANRAVVGRGYNLAVPRYYGTDWHLVLPNRIASDCDRVAHEPLIDCGAR
jgi:hypothetical protein